jgi:hypothetical protein
MAKPYETNIVIPKGYIVVHSFDLWGPIVNQEIIGKMMLDAYESLSMEKGIDSDEMRVNIANYIALMKGEPWAVGERKATIIDAVDDPVLAAKIDIPYADGFYDDALATMRTIFEAKEGVVIFSSKPADWLKANLPEDIAGRLGEIHAGTKAKPEAFRKVYESEKDNGRLVVSHTADELPELIAALESKLFDPDNIVYVNRNNSNSEDTVNRAGIEKYVGYLTSINYTGMCKKR